MEALKCSYMACSVEEVDTVYLVIWSLEGILSVYSLSYIIYIT